VPASPLAPAVPPGPAGLTDDTLIFSSIPPICWHAEIRKIIMTGGNKRWPAGLIFDPLSRIVWG
jgi:hypothetical protein